MSATATATRSITIYAGGWRTQASPDERLVEAIEISRRDHPFYVASQYHPEFKSRPERPTPLFREFVGAALAHAESESESGAAAEPSRANREPSVSVSRSSAS
jgi:hypothetical protein